MPSIASAPPRPPRGVQRAIATVSRGDGVAVDSVRTTNGAGGLPACALARPSAIAGHRASTERYGCPVPGAAIPSHSRATPVQRRTTPASSVASLVGMSFQRLSAPDRPAAGDAAGAAGRAPSAAWIVAAANASSESRSAPAVRCSRPAPRSFMIAKTRIPTRPSRPIVRPRSGTSGLSKFIAGRTTDTTPPAVRRPGWRRARRSTGTCRTAAHSASRPWYATSPRPRPGRRCRS